MKLLTTDAGAGYELVCPHCKFDHNHLVSVTVSNCGKSHTTQLTDVEWGTGSMAHMEHRDPEGSPSVVSNYICEKCGKVFSVVLQAHKGRTDISTVE